MISLNYTWVNIHTLVIEAMVELAKTKKAL